MQVGAVGSNPVTTFLKFLISDGHLLNWAIAVHCDIRVIKYFGLGQTENLPSSISHITF